MRLSKLAATALAVTVVVTGGRARASSVDELLASAARHVAAGDEEIALRRYTDALDLDPTCEACYLGLGALREKRADWSEADRVYSAGLLRRVTPGPLLTARARVRWASGRRAEAIVDLEEAMARDATPEGLRQLVVYEGELHLVPAQLRAARRLLALAETSGEDARVREARVLVAALVIVAGPVDPVAAPTRPDAARRALARAARMVSDR